MHRFWPLGLLLGLGLLLYAQSYEKWGDLIVDLGRDLYLPGRLLAGSLLYRDVLYNYGPIAPYVLAALVRVFGDGLVTFEMFGLLVGVAVLAPLWRAGALLGGRIAGFSAALLFLVFSFFAWSTWGCNFVLPYSYAATISTAFSCWSFYFLLRHLYGGMRARHWWWGVACMFAALFTKTEFGAAVLGVYALAHVLHRLPLARLAGAVLAGVALCGAFVALFASPGGRGHALLGENIARFAGNEEAAPFFSSVAGFDAVAKNVASQFVSLGKIALVMLLGVVGGRGWAGPGGGAWTGVARGAAALAGVGLVLWWGDATLFAAVPLTALLVLGHSLLGRPRGPVVLLAAFVLFSAPRILLNYSPAWYGFYLAVPSYVFVSYFVGQWLADRTGLVRWCGVSLACLLVAAMARWELGMWWTYGAMTSVLRTSKGSMRDFPTGRAEAIGAFLEYVKRSAPGRGASAVVFPEGVTLNYFSGLENPTAYYSFVPPEIGSSTEERRMTEELRAAAPDYVVIADRDVREFGRRGFGVDYALGIAQWVRQNYQWEMGFGERRGSSWGLALYRRRAPAGQLGGR